MPHPRIIPGGRFSWSATFVVGLFLGGTVEQRLATSGFFSASPAPYAISRIGIELIIHLLSAKPTARDRRQKRLSIALILILLATCGCAMPKSLREWTAASEKCDRLELIYVAQPTEGACFVAVPDGKPSGAGTTRTAGNGILPTSHEAQPSSAKTAAPQYAWAQTELVIRYPHPDGRTRYAQAALRLRPMDCPNCVSRETFQDNQKARLHAMERRRVQRWERWFFDVKPPVQETCPEIATIDIPKSELDALLGELSEHGFFHERRKPRDLGPTKIEVRRDRAWVCQAWDFEPDLDDVLSRVGRAAYEQSTSIEAAEQR